MHGIGSIGPYIGLVREATIRRVDIKKGTIRVAFDLSKNDSLPAIEFDVPIPAQWAGPFGQFSGGYPEKGATVWCTQGQGGQWSVSSYAPSTGIFNNNSTSSSISYFKNVMGNFRPGRWLTQVQNNIHIFADPKIGIQAGNSISYLHLDPTKDIFSNTFKEQMGFSEAHRAITGIVKRDRKSNSNRNITGSALTSHIYNESLEAVGLDPLTTAGGSLNRNPPFVENRYIVYEFANSFGFTNDASELLFYDDPDLLPEISSGFNRRESRADALSLSLLTPNQLIEHIEGTVVDIYGNILDINRSVLPSGQFDSLSLRTPAEDTQGNKSDVFISLREQARKSIAYHFEINSRKPNISGFEQLKTSITQPQDYARDRSKFYFDIDKEGQFKINVPSSSEVGNVPLLTRYENYTTLKAIEDDSNPNQFARNKDRQDIFLEGFGVGVINLTGGNDTLEGFAGPIDRIENVGPIKLGTAYHNLQDTLQLHNREDPIPVFWYPDSVINDQSSVPLVGDIVSTNVIVSGPDANAGGRSGTISLDGFLSLNIGANTVDRQSLWLDTAGGIVSNIGRDINNRSYMGRMDGDVFLQIGGTTVTGDSRFDDINNEVRDGTFDMRVVQAGNMHIIRISPAGVVVMTPGSCDIVSRGTLRLKSIDGDVIIDGRGIYCYEDGSGRGRWIQRKPGQTI